MTISTEPDRLAPTKPGWYWTVHLGEPMVVHVDRWLSKRGDKGPGSDALGYWDPWESRPVFVDVRSRVWGPRVPDWSPG